MDNLAIAIDCSAVIRSCYLAGPIDAVSQEEARDWQAVFAEQVVERAPGISYRDVLCFSPAHPYFNPTMGTAAILDEINRAAIRACDALVAYLPADRVAFGTIREIEYAKALGKHVIVIAPGGLKSFLRYDLDVFDSIEDAAAHLMRL